MAKSVVEPVKKAKPAATTKVMVAPVKPSAKVLLKKIVKEAKPLAVKPSSSVARDRFSEYVRDVEKRGSRFEILSRGKTIAVLGPIGSFPKGMLSRKTVSVSDFTLGLRTFSNVIHHGPFTIMRNNIEVAVLYPPQATDASRIQAILDSLAYIKVLELDLLRKSGEFFVMKEDLDDQAEAADEGI